MKIIVDKIDTYISEDGTVIVRGKGNVTTISTEKDEVWLMERPKEPMLNEKQKARIELAAMN